ncbi:hypothetical protein [uncultured Roseobacter sp.]|uniref:hypothetical protein n=1 Tax=uncultured Roseobacter sp. TaxID=114847 RepID=UPI0026183B2C|nr:hypothetical protein [uncultured Roseobacter sp.]
MHSISHWVDLQDLGRLTGLDIVAVFRSEAIARSLLEKKNPAGHDQLCTGLGGQQPVLRTIVCPALVSGFVDAKWTKGPSGELAANHKAASFDGYPGLQKSLERHLVDRRADLARRSRRARQEQVAW